MTAIFERELDSQLNGLTGYIYGALLLLFAGIYSVAYNLGGYAEFTYVLYSLSFILLIAVPLLTMRSFAEERHQGTDRLLYSLPLSMTKIVLGKYLALAAVTAMPLAVLCLYPPVIGALATAGTMHLKSAYSALLGFFFLGLALTAVGLFISSLMDSVALAAGGCFAALLLAYFITPVTGFLSEAPEASAACFAIALLLFGLLLWRLTGNGLFAGAFTLAALAGLGVCYLVWPDAFGGLFAKVVGQLALFDRFSQFSYDIFDVTALVYYGSVAAVFLFFTVQVMERRRWAA